MSKFCPTPRAPFADLCPPPLPHQSLYRFFLPTPNKQLTIPPCPHARGPGGFSHESGPPNPGDTRHVIPLRNPRKTDLFHVFTFSRFTFHVSGVPHVHP